ncbi:MAG: hypothetical protein DDT32_00757 [Syntrophomonadaceae bacterium]|nr:hypothetical protein [Bacillota bacterium]MBT9147005.1 hypothetical protein [Bacillota bacterium]
MGILELGCWRTEKAFFFQNNEFSGDLLMREFFKKDIQRLADIG